MNIAHFKSAGHWPTLLAAYPYMLWLLSEEAGKGRLHIRPQRVTSSADVLTAADRAAVRTAFGVEPYNYYCSTEVPYLAWECDANDGHREACRPHPCDDAITSPHEPATERHDSQRGQVPRRPRGDQFADRRIEPTKGRVRYPVRVAHASLHKKRRSPRHCPPHDAEREADSPAPRISVGTKARKCEEPGAEREH